MRARTCNDAVKAKRAPRRAAPRRAEMWRHHYVTSHPASLASGRKASYAIVRVKLVSAYRDEVYDHQIDPSELNNYYLPPKYVGGHWPAGKGPYALPAPASAAAEYEPAPKRRYKTSSTKPSKAMKFSPAILLNKRVEIIIGDHTGIHGSVTETTSRGWIRLDLDREPGETRVIYNTRPSWVQVLDDQNGPPCTKLTVFNRSIGKPAASTEGDAASASPATLAADNGHVGGVVAMSELGTTTEAASGAGTVAQRQNDDMEMERSGTSITSVDFELYTEPNSAEGGVTGAEGSVETASRTATASARAGVGPQSLKTD